VTTRITRLARGVRRGAFLNLLAFIVPALADRCSVIQWNMLQPPAR
jgi:hypothetical protein